LSGILNEPQMKVTYFSLILLAGLGLAACKKKGCTDPTADNYSEKAKKDDGSCTYTFPAYDSQIEQIKATYADMAFAVFDDSYNKAVDLQTAIQAFVNSPSQAGFDAAKQAWLDAREPYGQSEIFRFVEGPIDNSSDGPEGLLNAWPMDEAYVDYVDGSPNAGIINNPTTYPTIDQVTLVTANENGGEENISVGYHAIEFLLWGQDTSATSAGNRQYTDYVTGGSGTAANQDRRGQYLIMCSDLLVAALQQVRDAWDPAMSGNYRTTWLAMDNATALRKVINSLRVMAGTELSGERMYTAYNNMNQEDEHSCFSDNTHRDIILNAEGISNLYRGTYTRVNGTVISGYGLEDLVNEIAPTQNTQMINQLNATETMVNGLYIPFDQAIILPAERPKVLDAVNSLIAEKDIILNIAADNFNIHF